MSIASSMMRTPCTVVHVTEGAADDEGNPTRTDDAGTETVCELQQIRTQEGDDLALESNQWNIYLPAGLTLGGQDHVIIGLERYDLVGDPWPVNDPTSGQVDHLEAIVRRTS